ncbi:uncharacterized protein N7469_003613 [Penicillium citrinum]|uniref:Uncharacterized protein n=2 Tax=Penicillium TaxID=5073 RepID=A0A9W9TPU3_PENCI|nr:uncharacterized protein N7469_003613 [Penicillium citrinum]KAJ5234445.1 hypothetical protein N7469_003613 [Penicillium citrinum]KAJ5590065.1 hypothetical protein N7450_004037 [Penicillium hetheringtonii]
MPKCHQHPSTPPDHPIALRHSHLLAPAPDRLTNTPTTLTVTRENTHSGRDFSIHQLRKDEPLDSLRRTSLLYTASGRFWSNSQQREIRDASGRPLLELRRIWWRGQWIVKRAGGVGDELLSAEMRWGIGMKIGARFCNALIAGREGITLSRRGLSPNPYSNSSSDRPRPRTAVSSTNVIPASGPGSTSASAAAAATASASATTGQERIRPGPAYTRPTPTRRRTISNYPHAPPIARDAPPPYSATAAAGHATHSSGNDSTSNTPSAASSSTSLSSANDSDSDSDSKSRSTVLPSYESVRRMRRQSSRHSLRELLDAIEPPREPAPASAVPYPTRRRWSESCIDPRVELKVVQASGTVAEIMMGERKIVHVKRGRVVDYSGGARRHRWEVEIAEGVDLLLAVCLVLIIAESQSVRHESGY